MINLICGIPSTSVFLQGFNWHLASSQYSNSLIYQKIQDIAKTSNGLIHGIWFPPPSQSADNAGYMPGKWYKLKDHDVLSQTILMLKQKGILPIADIVLNHRTGSQIDSCTGKWTQFQDPNWGNWAIVKNDWMCQNEGGKPICSNGCHCSTHYDTGENSCGAPDIDHKNIQVQKDIIHWLHWLKNEIGFQGFRLDMVKGFSSFYTAKYIHDTKPLFAVGEYWDHQIDRVMKWVDEAHISSFDFPLRYALDEAIKHEKYYKLKNGIHPAGLMGLRKQKAMTFLDNHDMGRHGGEFGWKQKDLIIQGYVYILTHPGIPCIFYDHWERHDLNSVLRQLIQLRKRMGIEYYSNIYIDKSQQHLYAAYIGTSATKCHGKIAMKLGSDMSWSPCGNHWKLENHGNRWAIWVRNSI